MLNFDSHVLGVDINLQAINLCRYDISGYPFSICQLNLPQPAMPGAVTVAICDEIESIDPNRRADFVGVSLPGEVDRLGRTVESCFELPGWLDVPLSDWLEPRLSRRVIVINSSECSMVGEDCLVKSNRCDNDLVCTLGAAHLAFERFNCVAPSY